MQRITKMMQRMTFYFLAGLCLLFSSTISSADQKSNIVLLLADDMGYGDLGCYGSPIVQSPNLDKLASQGIRLEQCYAASPNCSPARVGMLTGRSPYRAGMYDFARFKPLHIPSQRQPSPNCSSPLVTKRYSLGSGIVLEILNHNPIRGIMVSIIGCLIPRILAKMPKAEKRNGEKVNQAKGWMLRWSSMKPLSGSMTTKTQTNRFLPACGSVNLYPGFGRRRIP